MRGRSLIAVLVASALVFAFAASGAGSARAEDRATALDTPGALSAQDTVGEQPADASASDPSAVADRPVPAHPIVTQIRSKLEDPALRKAASPGDIAALEFFYAAWPGPPLWITSMGFSAKGQKIIDEIGMADDWGLSAAAIDLPSPSQLPPTEEAQARAEIELGLAALQYARFARGGRVVPRKLSPLVDQGLALRDPRTVVSEIAASSAPDAYLRSLHPKHEQFERLRQALLKARAAHKEGGKKAGKERKIQRLIVNMERWRWMPKDLGSFYVWNNSPEFVTKVVKDGKTIYTEKTIVGQLAYATPIFSADMTSIVFHPQWVVPVTIVKEDLQPPLRGGGFFGLPDTSILRKHDLAVSLKGKPVDPNVVDWKNENIHRYTFTQPPGPKNVLGALKFNFPNKHAIYMHDTPQPELFAEETRTLSHGCIRVKDPNRLAALLLAEDKGWSAKQVDKKIASRRSGGIKLGRSIPVHLTYFTAVVDDKGRVETFPDIYGLDGRIASTIFGKRIVFAGLAENVTPQRPRAGSPSFRRTGGLGGIQGLFGN